MYDSVVELNHEVLICACYGTKGNSVNLLPSALFALTGVPKL